MVSKMRQRPDRHNCLAWSNVYLGFEKFIKFELQLVYKTSNILKSCFFYLVITLT